MNVYCMYTYLQKYKMKKVPTGTNGGTESYTLNNPNLSIFSMESHLDVKHIDSACGVTLE